MSGQLLKRVQVGFGIAAGIQLPFNHFAFQIEQDNVVTSELIIWNTTGFDSPNSFVPINAADISPGQLDQSGRIQKLVGFGDFIFQVFQHFSKSRVDLKLTNTPSQIKRNRERNYGTSIRISQGCKGKTLGQDVQDFPQVVTGHYLGGKRGRH